MKTKITFLVLLGLGISCTSKKEKMREPKSETREVIYGEDNRQDTTDALINSPDGREGHYANAYSAAGMVKRKYVLDGRGDEKLLYSPYNFRDGNQLCSGERFSEQRTSPSCSGFLVSKNILVTAGHCVEQDKYKQQRDCDKKSWIFNLQNSHYKRFNNGEYYAILKPDQVYHCKKILSTKLDSDRRDGLDYAVILLDRDVTGRKPLKYRTSGQISNSDTIMVIGHPSGLPSKITTDGKIMENYGINSFKSFIDTYGGNSGSAAFNEDTGIVEGILVSGATDFIEKPGGGGCFSSNRCPERRGYRDCGGERIIRIRAVPGLSSLVAKYSGGSGTTTSSSISSRSSSRGWVNGAVENVVMKKGTRAKEMVVKVNSSRSVIYRIRSNNCSINFRGVKKGSSFHISGGFISKFFWKSSCQVVVEGRNSEIGTLTKKLNLSFK